MGRFSLLTTLTLNASGFNSGVSSAQKSTQNFKRGTEQASSAISSSFKNMSGILGGAVNSQIGMLGSSLQSGIGAFRSMIPAINGVKMALISSGIGAIVVAIGLAFSALSSYLTGTKDGADKLNIIMNGLKATFRVIIERVNFLGSALVKLFEGDFKGMKEDFQSAFKGGIFDEIKEGFKEGVAFGIQQNELKRRKIQLDREELDINARKKELEEKARNYAEGSINKQKAYNQMRQIDEKFDAKKLKYYQDSYNLALKIYNQSAKSYEDEEKLTQAYRDLQSFKAEDLQESIKYNKLGGKINTELKVNVGSETVNVSDLESKIKEGIYGGKNVLELVAELDIQRKKEDETDSIFSQLTNPLQNLTLPEDSSDDIVNQINDDIINMDIPPIKLDLAPIPVDTINGITQQVQGLTGTLSGFFDSESAQYKAFAVIQALISTYLAAVQVMANQAKLGPIAMGIAFTSTIATGLLAVSKIKAFKSGGIIGGNSFSGDKVLARVNSGEMVLNSSQQARLFDIANSGGYGGKIRFEIEGTKLVGVMSKLNNLNKSIR